MAVILVKSSITAQAVSLNQMQGLVLHKLCYNEKKPQKDMPMHDTNMMHSYLPMQKREKMVWRMVSVVISPVISPR